MPQRKPAAAPAKRQTATTPCGSPNRDPLDVVGRLNDLINCYIQTAAANVKTFLIAGTVFVILLAIMLISAHKFLTE